MRARSRKVHMIRPIVVEPEMGYQVTPSIDTFAEQVRSRRAEGCWTSDLFDATAFQTCEVRSRSKKIISFFSWLSVLNEWSSTVTLVAGTKRDVALLLPFLPWHVLKLSSTRGASRYCAYRATRVFSCNGFHGVRCSEPFISKTVSVSNGGRAQS